MVDVVEEESVDLNALYDQYNMCTKIEREAKKQKQKIKEQLDAFFATSFLWSYIY